MGPAGRDVGCYEHLDRAAFHGDHQLAACVNRSDHRPDTGRGRSAVQKANSVRVP